MNNFSEALIAWYMQNKRDLPWRGTIDPYRIWISEVILQQTRVAQGFDYYIRFTERFPTVYDLANAPLDDVLKVWQGLGYYSRARNMHHTAKQVVEQHNGKFPDTYEGLLKLKGVGDYTASAIAAFAFKRTIAAVDGNVYRVFSRYCGVFTPIDSTSGRKELHAIAQQMVSSEHPDIYNQAIMDFGALMCAPKKPLCYECPVLESCYAFRNGCVNELPVKTKKAKQRNRYFAYIMVKQAGYTYICRRDEQDIWHSLYEFPLIESEADLSPEQLIETAEWQLLFGKSRVEIVHISALVKHQLSHQTLFTRFYIINLQEANYELANKFSRVRIDEVGEYSTPRLIDSYLAAEPAMKYFL